jgi:hypothetical protein
MKFSSLTAVIIIILIIIISCHHKADLSTAPPKPAPPGPEFKCSHDTTYFQNTVLPIILTGCARTGCHDAATHKEDLILDSYSNIRNLVVPFNPQSSKLYTVLFSGDDERMPPDSPFTVDQKSIIYWWINQGAHNNRCDSTGCDSANVTYTSSISPIIRSWCLGCHSGSNPSHGLHLETYAEVVACANSNRLMGAIRQETGFSPMPQGGKLSICEIALFQKWINLGKPQ